jgi:Flp pilus assembly protein TadG
MRGPRRRQTTRTGRRVGQALVELALIAPVLLMLALGASQVGAITYAQVSLDTAAREGARAGVEAPNSSLAWDAGSAVPSLPYKCSGSDFTYAPNSGNPICYAVINAGGYLDPNAFKNSSCGANQACVTINVESTLASAPAHPVVRLASAPQTVPNAGGTSCNGSDATITGTISGIPAGRTATVTDSSNDTQGSVTSTYTLCAKASGGSLTENVTATVPGPGPCSGFSGSTGNFTVTKGATYTENLTVTDGYAYVSGTITGIPSGPPQEYATVTDSTGETTSNITSSYGLCVTASGSVTAQTITAQVGSTTCGGYNGSSGSFPVTGGSSYTANFSVSPEQSCSSSTTTTTSSSSSSSSTTSASSTSTASSSGTDCSPWPKTGEYDYITVTVTYPVTIFVPVVGALFDNGSGVHMITSSVTFAIAPCGITGDD